MDGETEAGWVNNSEPRSMTVNSVGGAGEEAHWALGGEEE